MTTTTIARGSNWGISANVGAFAFGYDGINQRAVGRWIVSRFHELCAEAGREDVTWTPETSEVIADVDSADLPEVNVDELREQATREADELACSDTPPDVWYAAGETAETTAHTRTADQWWRWHDADSSRWSGGEDPDEATADAERRCAAWVAGESDDGPDAEIESVEDDDEDERWLIHSRIVGEGGPWEPEGSGDSYATQAEAESAIAGLEDENEDGSALEYRAVRVD